METPNNNKANGIYKTNSNLVNFISQQDNIKQLSKVERDSTITKYGRNSYCSKLINHFRSDKTKTSNYWMEISE